MIISENVGLSDAPLRALLSCLSANGSVKVHDWQAVIEAANRHGVAPVLFANLQNHCRRVLPETLLHELDSAFRANALRNLMRTRELLRLLHL